MLIFIRGKFGTFMLWLLYFILLHIVSLKTATAAANYYPKSLQCFECFSHEKQCDEPIDPTSLPRTLCNNPHNDGRSYNDNNAFLKRAFPFINMTTIETTMMKYVGSMRDKRQIDVGYYYGYSCLKIKVSGKESGTIRGCTHDRTDVCAIAKQYLPRQLRIDSCVTCKDSFCNGATAISTLSIFMIITMSIITIIFSNRTT